MLYSVLSIGSIIIFLNKKPQEQILPGNRHKNSWQKSDLPTLIFFDMLVEIWVFSGPNWGPHEILKNVKVDPNRISHLTELSFIPWVTLRSTVCFYFMHRARQLDRIHVRLVCGRSRVRSSRPETFFRGDWSWNNFFYGHSLPSADSRKVVLMSKECALSTDKLPRRLAQEQCG